MYRLLAMVSIGLLVALAPATRGQGLILANPIPAWGPVDPSGLPPGSGVTIESTAPVHHGPSGDPTLFDLRGISELAAGEYEQAIADFDEAIRSDPTNANFFYHRSLADFRAEKTPIFNNLDRALGDLFDAILRDPTKPEYYLARARVFTRMERFQRARDDYNTVLRSDPTNTEAFKEREELKVRVLAYVAPADPAPDEDAKPTPDPLTETLKKALKQATINEAVSRQEKAKLDAAAYQYQRAHIADYLKAQQTPAKQPPSGSSTPTPDAGKTATTTPSGTTNITINTGPMPPAAAAPAVQK